MLNVAKRFGVNLRRCRTEAGLTQEETADRASLHRTEIGLLEVGSRLPRVDTMAKLAGALDVSINELMAGIEWVPPAIAETGRFRDSETRPASP